MGGPKLYRTRNTMPGHSGNWSPWQKMPPDSYDARMIAEGDFQVEYLHCDTCGDSGEITYEEMGSPGPNGSYTVDVVSVQCPDCTPPHNAAEEKGK